MLSVIEKPKKTVALKRAVKNSKLLVDEPPKLYIVSVNNYVQEEKEGENKPEQDLEKGLPHQPKEYLKYPDYDWFWLNQVSKFLK